jgi:hypothetical protein
MKPKSRSAVTNSPPTNSPRRTAKATARRVRDLYAAYLGKLGDGPHDPIVQSWALSGAELAVICEGLRARALAGEDIDINDLTRAASTLDRAERALIKGGAVEKEWSPADLAGMWSPPATSTPETDDGEDVEG